MASVRVPTEHEEQAALHRWLDLIGVRHFSVPNGAMLGGRNRFALLNKLKAEGLLNGAPDLVLIDMPPHYSSHVAVEMKRRDGKPSAQQEAVHVAMRSSGWVVVVGYGFEDARIKLEELGYG